MLSQSDIFNRLPISDEQKKTLLDLILNEPQKEMKRPECNSDTLVEPIYPTQVELTKSSDTAEELI